MVLQTHRLNGKLNDVLTDLGAIWRCVCHYPVGVCKFKDNKKEHFLTENFSPETTELIPNCLTVRDCFLKSLQRDKFLIQSNKSQSSQVRPSISQMFILYI